MGGFYIKGLGMVENTPENRDLLIKKGLIEDDTAPKRTNKSDSVDIVRVGKRKRSK